MSTKSSRKHYDENDYVPGYQWEQLQFNTFILHNHVRHRMLHSMLQDWQFDDGTVPPTDIIDDWFALLRRRFKEEPECCVAVHCVAGLGRWVLFGLTLKVPVTTIDALQHFETG